MESHETVPLSVSDIMAAAPIDQKLNPGDGGIVFTIGNQRPMFNDAHVPAYRDPSHLAAWIIGYWTAQHELAEAQHHIEEKES